jgi:hypothetical protein
MIFLKRLVEANFIPVGHLLGKQPSGTVRPTMSRFLEIADRLLCRAGILAPASWDLVRSGRARRLYAGRLSRELPQFRTHIGITPFDSSTRNIRHDLRERIPVGNNSVDVFQSEDVFEHIPYDELPGIVSEVFRILAIGGLFRLSVPDYRSHILRHRSIIDADGAVLFDPGGGGSFQDGKVIDGGHVWFPVYETVKALFDSSRFEDVQFLHYTDADGLSVLNPIDYSLGNVQRTPDHDPRVSSPRQAMSIVVDAWKR